VFALGSEQVNGVGLAEPGWIQIAAKGALVREDNNDLLVRRGWGASSQRRQKGQKGSNLRMVEMYAMLSAHFLSTYCFY